MPCLLKTYSRDIRLVFVDGKPLYGDRKTMRDLVDRDPVIAAVHGAKAEAVAWVSRISGTSRSDKARCDNDGEDEGKDGADERTRTADLLIENQRQARAGRPRGLLGPYKTVGARVGAWGPQPSATRGERGSAGDVGQEGVN
jgi:hypothetical protein